MPDMRVPPKQFVTRVELVVHLKVNTREVVSALGGNNEVVDGAAGCHGSRGILRFPWIPLQNVSSYRIKPAHRNYVSRKLVRSPSGAFLSNRCRVVDGEAKTTERK